MSLLKRFPEKGQIVSVYAVGAAILYSWAILKAIQEFAKNWSLHLSVSEILGLFSYTLAGTFFESVLFLAALLLISFILPKKIFANKFVLRGSILTITFLGSIIYLYTQTFTYALLDNIGEWGVSFVSFTFFLMLLGELNEFVARIIQSIADRCTVLLYIYLPVSFISMIVIFIRNVG
ncbi:MAG: hypothetical protein JNM02_12220 [Anaerolineales bacterium]|nr:hypothetical protein [Anaerolineales bacterium]